MDREAAALVDPMSLDGQAASCCVLALAALIWKKLCLVRQMGGRMTQMRPSLQGWRRLCPAERRLPLPYCAVRMMAMQAMAEGDRELAIYRMVCVEVYVRPAEPLDLRSRDVVPGQVGLGRGTAHTAVLFHPWVVGVPSKTYEDDQALVLDLPRHLALSVAFVRMVEGRPCEEPLFKPRPGGMGVRMRGLAAALRLEALGVPHPYRLRHSRASQGFVSGARLIDAIRLRGRWRDARSLRQYQHGARVSCWPASGPPRHLRRRAAVPRVRSGRRRSCRPPRSAGLGGPPLES